MGDPLPGTQPSQRSSREHLDSWKEIAAYLGRDVTTAQRWEKREGMPIHRHLHDKRGLRLRVKCRAGCLVAKPQSGLGRRGERARGARGYRK